MRGLPRLGRKHLHDRHHQPGRRRPLALRTQAAPRLRPISIRPGAFDRVLAGGAALLLAAILAAIVRGHSRWLQASPLIWLHLATIVIALTLTPILLLRSRGTMGHRVLGYMWVVAMTATAA